MPNSYFHFKQFTVFHDRCAMKVTTDSCFFGAWAAREIQHAENKIQTVLDIGTGSGLLSLMIAQKNDVTIDAVEIEKEAAQQAGENVEACSWKNRIHVFNEDILSFQPGKKYDAIICNPPFYEKELASATPKKNIAHHSKQLTIPQVLGTVKAHLKESGYFFLMYPFKRKEEIETRMKKNNLSILKSILLQQSLKHVPFRVIIMGTNQPVPFPGPLTLSIWNEERQYTASFVDFLKEYYLYL